MPQSCIVHIHDAHQAEDRLLFDVLKRVRNYEQAQEVNIYVQPRVPADAPAYKHPGWLEYIVRVDFADGGKLTIGAIQRTSDAATEFHS